MHTMRPSFFTQTPRMPADFGDAINRLFEARASEQSDVVTSDWTPRVDVHEEDGQFRIRADIPGVDPKNIEVNMNKGMLSIRGERKEESSEDNGKFARVERAHGVFHRRFALPDSADAENIRANGRHGVLEITIPKQAEAASRKIEIETD